MVITNRFGTQTEGGSGSGSTTGTNVDSSRFGAGSGGSSGPGAFPDLPGLGPAAFADFISYTPDFADYAEADFTGVDFSTIPEFAAIDVDAILNEVSERNRAQYGENIPLALDFGSQVSNAAFDSFEQYLDELLPNNKEILANTSREVNNFVTRGLPTAAANNATLRDAAFQNTAGVGGSLATRTAVAAEASRDVAAVQYGIGEAQSLINSARSTGQYFAGINASASQNAQNALTQLTTITPAQGVQFGFSERDFQYNAALNNAQILNSESQFNANAYNANQQFNTNSFNANQQFNTSSTNSARAFEASAYNATSQFNTGVENQFNIANTAADREEILANFNYQYALEQQRQAKKDSRTSAIGTLVGAAAGFALSLGNPAGAVIGAGIGQALAGGATGNSGAVAGGTQLAATGVGLAAYAGRTASVTPQGVPGAALTAGNQVSAPINGTSAFLEGASTGNVTASNTFTPVPLPVAQTVAPVSQSTPTIYSGANTAYTPTSGYSTPITNITGSINPGAPGPAGYSSFNGRTTPASKLLRN